MSIDFTSQRISYEQDELKNLSYLQHLLAC